MFRQQNLYLLLFSLYWAQGLPVGFMTHALPEPYRVCRRLFYLS